MNSLYDCNMEKAEKAFDWVIKITSEKNVSDKFKSHIKNIPMYIYNNGLLATMAFIIKKVGDEKHQKPESKSYKYIFEIIEEFLQDNHDYFIENYSAKTSKRGAELLRYLIGLKPKEYRKITNSLLSYIEWVKRFAESIIIEDGKGDEDE